MGQCWLNNSNLSCICSGGANVHDDHSFFFFFFLCVSVCVCFCFFVFFWAVPLVSEGV